jgi:hypothetical protein
MTMNGRDYLTKLPPNLRPGGQGLVTSEMQILAHIAEGANPSTIKHATFPQTGLLEPIPAGTTTFDLTVMRIVAPHRTFNLNTNMDYSEIRSFLVAVDAPIHLTLLPIGQRTLALPGIYEIAVRDVQQIIGQADAPFLGLMQFSTVVNGTDVFAQSIFAQRYSATALSKTAATGLSDGFSELTFVPRQYNTFAGEQILTQATFGVASVPTIGYANKTFLVRNLGAVAVDVRLMGAMFVDVGAVYGYVADPDTGAGGGAPVTIPASSSVVLRTSTPWVAMQVHGRVSAAEAAGTSSTVVVELLAQVPGGGGR